MLQLQIRQYVSGNFIDYYFPTIEERFEKKILLDGKPYLLEILDSSGVVINFFLLFIIY